MKAKKTKFPYVYRVVYEADGTDGYLAKVVRRTVRLHKVFQLSKFDGDHEKCMRAAAAESFAFAEKHPRMSRRELAEMPRKKKDDDLPVGVRRVTNQVKGRFYDFYEAEWSPRPNEQKKKRFSVNLYGEDEALEMAIEARERGVEEMDE